MDSISLLMIGAMMVVFWLFFIRPQAKQARMAKEFQANIEKGAKVVTAGGIHGKIVKIDDTSLLLEIDNNVKMRVDKSALSMELTNAAYGAAEKKPEVVESAKKEG